jgi:site-specific DNA-cytosine methylase
LLDAPELREGQGVALATGNTPGCTCRNAGKIVNAAEVEPGKLDLLFAGPPCQGFSIIGSRVVWDQRNNLFLEVIRLASELRPRCVVRAMDLDDNQ